MMWLRTLRDACYDLLQRYLNPDVFSIWHTRNAQCRRDYEVLRMMRNWFPWFYYFFLLYSLLGLVHNFIQLLRVKLTNQRLLTMWRERVFYSLRDKIIRQMRLAGSLIMVACWLMLFVGLLLKKPRYLRPWLVISRPILVFDLLLWSVEIMFGHDNFSWHTLFGFVLPSMCQYLIGNMKKLLNEPGLKLL